MARGLSRGLILHSFHSFCRAADFSADAAPFADADPARARLTSTGFATAESVCERARRVPPLPAATELGSGIESMSVWAEAKVVGRKEARPERSTADHSMGPRALKGSWWAISSGKGRWIRTAR